MAISRTEYHFECKTPPNGGQIQNLRQPFQGFHDTRCHIRRNLSSSPLTAVALKKKKKNISGCFFLLFLSCIITLKESTYEKKSYLPDWLDVYPAVRLYRLYQKHQEGRTAAWKRQNRPITEHLRNAHTRVLPHLLGVPIWLCSHLLEGILNCPALRSVVWTPGADYLLIWYS